MPQIILKNSTVPLSIPTELHIGELAINSSDGLVFYKNTDGSIKPLNGVQPMKTINGELITGEGNLLLPSFSDLSRKADTVHTHSVTDITETLQKSFISVVEKEDIAATKQEVLNQTQRIVDIEQSIRGLENTDELVKLTSTSESPHYLSDLLNPDIFEIEGDKVTVVGLKGLLVNTDDLNTLQGVTGNIQQQINALTRVGAFKEAAQTYQDMLDLDISSIVPGDIIVVLDDETKDNKSTLYIFSNNDWVFAGNFKGGEIRDFETNPINLATETRDILPLTRMELPKASMITIDDSAGNFSTNTVEGALSELFIYANNIKSSVVNAIGAPLLTTDTSIELANKILLLKQGLAAALVGKGVYSHSSEDLSVMAEKIDGIKTISVSGINKNLTVNVPSVPRRIDIELSAPINISEVTTSIFTRGASTSGQTLLNETFGVDSQIKYTPNERLTFDNGVSVNTRYKMVTTEVPFGDVGRVYTTELDSPDLIEQIILEVI